MIGFSSLHLFLCFLSDLLEHYPLVIWGVFACVVVLAVYSGGGVVIIPPEVEVYYRLVSPHYSGWVVIRDYSLTPPITVPLV